MRTTVDAERAPRASGFASQFPRWLSIGAVIAIATSLGSWLSFPDGKACLWPASGLALAFLYRGADRERPAILTIVFFATALTLALLGEASLQESFGFALAGVIEAVLAIYLMKVLGQWLIDNSGLVDQVTLSVKAGAKKSANDRPPTLGTWQNVAAFVLGPCMIATAIAASIRATVATTPNEISWVGEWMHWWTAAGIGVLIFGSASFVVTEAWRQNPITDIGRPAIWMLLIGQIGLTIYIFAFQTLPIVYTVIPLFILLALFGQPIDGVTGLIVLTLVAAWCTTQGWGPFSESDRLSTATGLLQLYVGVCGVSVLAFTAFVRHKDFQQANSQFQLQTIVDSLNAQVFLKDTKNNILRANRVAAASLGRDPKDIAGRHASEFYPTLYEKFAADEAEILASGEAVSIIEHIPMSDGSVCVAETYKSPFRDEHGNIAGIVTVLNDITALKRAEGELLALGRLIEESSTEIFLFSAESLRFVRANRRAIENLGYTEEELFAMTPVDIKPEHTTETFADAIEPLKHSMDATVQFETQHQRKNGTTYDASIVLQRMSYQDTDVYVAFVLDVSDRMRSAEMIENLFSLSPVAQLLFDQRGVIECNEATLKLLKLTNKDEMLGRQPGEFSPEFQPCGTRSEIKAQPIIEHAYRTGFHRFEWSHVRADGTEFVTDVMMRLVRVESGDALLVIWNDITDRKNYETQLVATQKRLESINEELAQFAYIASHDLKAPLRGISNLADFVMEDCAELLPDESVDHLQKMKGRIKRMGKLLDDLLAYSRVGRSHGAMSEATLDDLARRAVQDSGVPEKIEVTVQADDLGITTLEAPLQVCLRNLIANAIKHRKEPHGMLRLTATDAIENVEFRIMDDGYGIPPEHFARIFRMFETLRPRDEIEGSGMGLAFVKKTVDTYGGSIQLQSPNEFGGTTFILSWPKRIRV